MENEIWIDIGVAIILFVFGLISGRYWNRKLIRKLEQQNIEQKEMLEKSYKAIGALKEQPKRVKRSSESEKLVKELALYGIKEWGKQKIDEWLYPDEYD